MRCTVVAVSVRRSQVVRVSFSEVGSAAKTSAPNDLGVLGSMRLMFTMYAVDLEHLERGGQDFSNFGAALAITDKEPQVFLVVTGQNLDAMQYAVAACSFWWYQIVDAIR